MRRVPVLIAVLGVALALPSWNEAEGPAPALPPLALQVPWNRIDHPTSFLVRSVMAGAAVAHQVDGIWYRSRKEIFDYLVERPDLAADVARVLKEGKYRVWPSTAGYDVDDGRGIRGVFRPVLTDGDRRVFYLEGRYDRPLLPTLSGRLVLVVETDYRASPGGTRYAETRVATFLQLDSAVLKALAHVALPLSRTLMDRRIRRFFGHVERVSQRAYDDPEGLAEELERHPALTATRVAEFRQLLLADRLPGWAEQLRFHLAGASLMPNSGHPPVPR